MARRRNIRLLSDEESSSNDSNSKKSRLTTTDVVNWMLDNNYSQIRIEVEDSFEKNKKRVKLKTKRLDETMKR